MSTTTYVTPYSYVTKPCVNVVVMVTLEVFNAANNPGLIVARYSGVLSRHSLYLFRRVIIREGQMTRRRTVSTPNNQEL